MSELADLEQQLTDALRTRAASASPPTDAWDRIVDELISDTDPIGGRAGVVVDINHDTEPEFPTEIESWRHWPIAVIGAAAAVLLLIVVLISRTDTDEENIFTDDREAPDTDAPDPGTRDTRVPDPEVSPGVSAVSVGPGAWSVAASFTGAVDAEAVAGVVDEVRTWPGVVSIVSVSTPDEWQALTGFSWDCAAGASEPGCGAGVLAWVVNSQMVQTAIRLESELEMLAVTVDDRPRDFVQGYFDAAAEVASPVPLGFDPDDLGTEQPLRKLARSEFGDFCDAPGSCATPVAVDIGGFVIRAGVWLPSAEEEFHQLGILEGEGSGHGIDLNDFLLDADGEGGSVVAAASVGGRSVYRIAGLPLEAAVVTTRLGDGSDVWQRPIGGMMLIVDQPGTGQDEDDMVAGPLGPFIVLDANGVEIMHIGGATFSPSVLDLRIDPDSLTGTEIATSAGTASDVEVAVTDIIEGLGWPSAAIVTTDDALWGTDSHSGGVFRIDAATRRVTGTVPIGDGQSLLATSDAVWAVRRSTDGHSGEALLRIDPSSLMVTHEVEVGGGVQAAYEVDGDVWVVAWGGGAPITQIAPETSADGSISWQVVATYPAPPGSTWWSALVDGAIWGAYSDQSLLWRFDPASGQITDQIPTGFDGTTEEGAVVSHDAIWLIHHDGTAIRVDRNTREVTDILQLGGGLRTGVTTADALWLPNVDRGTLTRIDLAQREITDVISVGGGAGRPLATDFAIWVPSWHSGTVTRIDIESRSVTHSIETGVGSRTPLEFDGAIWVPSLNQGTLTRIEVG